MPRVSLPTNQYMNLISNLVVKKLTNLKNNKKNAKFLKETFLIANIFSAKTEGNNFYLL